MPDSAPTADLTPEQQRLLAELDRRLDAAEAELRRCRNVRAAPGSGLEVHHGADGITLQLRQT